MMIQFFEALQYSHVQNYTSSSEQYQVLQSNVQIIKNFEIILTNVFKLYQK